MKRIILLATLLLTSSLQAQQRDRLAELNPACRNEAVTHTSVAPDGSLWMVSQCGEIFRADNIHSPWRTLEKGSLGSLGKNYNNIIAFDYNTAVILGNIWADGFKDIKRTSTGGLMWDKIEYSSIKGDEWFHPAWRSIEGRMWIGSQDGMLAFSADSGRTFITLRDTAFDHKTGIAAIYMCSADSGWIICDDGNLYSTNDNWHTYHRHSTPGDKGVSLVRPWKNYLIARQDGKSYYTTADGASGWKCTPLTLRYFEVDTSNGTMWALDDSKQVVLMEDIDHWKHFDVNALHIIGIHDGRLYCRTEEGVMRIGANGKVDVCPLLTDERLLDEPEYTLAHGNLLWGYDEKSVYILDAKGWYRVARPLNIAGITPEREDRVIIMTDPGEMQRENAGKTFSVDTAGHVAPYTYLQPLAAFVKPGLQSLEITTYKTMGYNLYKETIGYRRRGGFLMETSRNAGEESRDLHFIEGTSFNDDTVRRQLAIAPVEQALLTLGECYHLYPTPQDFGMDNTSLDLHNVYYYRNVSSSNKYGYTITLVNQADDTLTAWDTPPPTATWVAAHTTPGFCRWSSNGARPNSSPTNPPCGKPCARRCPTACYTETISTTAPCM